MKRRRTKKDKIIANLRRQVITRPVEEEVIETPQKEYKKKSSTIHITKPESARSESSNMESIFSLDSHFIRRDLLRTAILTAIVFSIEFALFFIWRS